MNKTCISKVRIFTLSRDSEHEKNVDKSEEESSFDEKTVKMNHEDDLCNVEDVEKDKGM